MKSILMTSSAAALVALSAGMAQAACPEDIDAFTREYEAAMAAGTDAALSASEQAELFGLRTTAENLFRAGELEMCAEAIDRAQLMLDTAIAPTALLPGQLVDMEVRNAAGEYLGDVEDITLDPVSGRIAYLLIEHGGFLGIGDNLFAVPWRAVTWSPAGDSLLLDITEERLEQGPRFIEDQETPQERRAWLLSVHNYYGMQPYWQDSMASMALAGQSGQTQQAGADVVLAVPVEVESSQPAQGAGAGQSPEEAVIVPDADPTVVVPAAEPDQGASAGQSGGADVAAVAVVPATDTQEGQGGIGSDAMSRLMERIDQLEARIQEMSGQGVGEEVRQSLSSLQDQVRQLADSGPGENVRQAIEELRNQMQALAQQGPGEEVRAMLSQLESQVQQLSESRPGEEVRQAIASLESRVQELARSEPGTELRDMLARMESQLRELAGRPEIGAGVSPRTGAAAGAAAGLQPGAGELPIADQPAAIVGPSGAGQASGGTARPQQPVDAMAGAERPVIGAATTGQRGAERTLEMIEQERGDGTTVYSTVRTPRAAGTAPASSREAVGEQIVPVAPTVPAEPTVPGGTTETMPGAQGGTPGQGAALGAGATAGQGAEVGLPGAGGAAVEAPAGVGAAAGQASLAGQPVEAESCEMGITQLEEDLGRAQQEGVSIAGAQTELQAAQAMLRRASEALCRAAIKRAREELVTQGFQPQAVN